MNPFMVAAAILAFAAGPLHSILGEKLLLRPVFQHPLPGISGSEDFARRTLRMFWHVIGFFWWGFAALLLAVAGQSEPDRFSTFVANVVGWTFLASAVYALIQTKGKHFAGGLFLLIAILVFWGAR